MHPVQTRAMKCRLGSLSFGPLKSFAERPLPRAVRRVAGEVDRALNALAHALKTAGRFLVLQNECLRAAPEALACVVPMQLATGSDFSSVSPRQTGGTRATGCDEFGTKSELECLWHKSMHCPFLRASEFL